MLILDLQNHEMNKYLPPHKLSSLMYFVRVTKMGYYN